MNLFALLSGWRIELTPIVKANTKKVNACKSTSADAPKLKDPMLNPLEPPNFSSGHEFVTLIAGRGVQEKKFVVHKEFACHYSPTLKAAFNSEFVEGQTQTYKLCDLTTAAEEDVVQVLVQWLYTQKLELEALTLADEDISKNFNRNVTLATKLWVLADKLVIRNLQNQAMDYIWTAQETTKYVGTSVLNFVHQHALIGNPLRRIFVMFCAQNVPSTWYMAHATQFPHYMLLELVEHLAKHGKAKVSRTPAGSMESFHVEE